MMGIYDYGLIVFTACIITVNIKVSFSFYLLQFHFLFVQSLCWLCVGHNGTYSVSINQYISYLLKQGIFELAQGFNLWYISIS